MRFVSAYATWLITVAKRPAPEDRGWAVKQPVVSNNPLGKVVVGRDARVSGKMVRDIVVGTLTGMGLDVVDIGLASTPTTEIAVQNEVALGGIIITASHNPADWNALKLLNCDGEFLSAADGAAVLDIAERGAFQAAKCDDLGCVKTRTDYDKIHIDRVLSLPLVNAEAIGAADFRVGFDAINSVGGLILPKLLERLGVKRIEPLNPDPSGHFAHNPEPLPENLFGITRLVQESGCDIGFVVDPDVDRLAMVCADGSMFGEEYTIVSCADYVLSHTPGNTVSNLSSSRALADVTRLHGGEYTAAAVGEVNVVAQMKATNAVIGGEGNGGVIYPECHYGRDALVGIALMLTQMATTGKSAAALRASYPNYSMSKNRIDLRPGTDIDALLAKMAEKYAADKPNTIDGVKIDFADSWVHFRKSNTEPIIRVYSEAPTAEAAAALAKRMKEEIMDYMG